ncbi:MAG: HAMP domain-containing histidine kinase [Ruminococcus sp.]|nr:HAMP domain-containing histidine kinase [Ruminococcus sp.]
MKLWQKIFLSSLFLIIAAVNIISVTILNNSHRLLLEREQTHAISEHEFFEASFSNAVVYAKLADEKIALTPNDIRRIASDVVEGSGRTRDSAVFDSEGTLIAVNGMDDVLSRITQSGFIEKIDSSGDNYSASVYETGGAHKLAVGSAITTEGMSYRVVTAVDISEIYAMKKKQTDFVRKVSVISAGAISLVLLVTVLLMLNPLSRLNVYTKAIAGGNYRIRIRERGSLEFRELAQNMNIMAEAVQTNAARLEKIAEDRQTFIANLSHEMKTPLTSILGFADILRIKRQVSDSERAEYAGVIVEETKRLRSLSGKLMGIVAMNGTEMEKKPVSLQAMINETKTALVPLLAKNDVQLECLSQDITISADEELFKSLLYNIIENAVKASPKGESVVLNAAMYQGDAVITITDHGIGMTPEVMKKAFEPFFMADKSRSRKAGGAGLGLALCQKIASLHSAKIEIDSHPNEGTTVFITIPREECL